MSTNINPDTGIHYGVVSCQSLCGDLYSELYNKAYSSVITEMTAEAQREIMEDNPGMSESEAEHETALVMEGVDNLDCVSAVIEHEGVKLKFTELGGAHIILVLESKYTCEAPICSPCVSGACDLDSIQVHGNHDIKCYTIPSTWWEVSKLIEVKDNSIQKLTCQLYDISMYESALSIQEREQTIIEHLDSDLEQIVCSGKHLDDDIKKEIEAIDWNKVTYKSKEYANAVGLASFDYFEKNAFDEMVKEFKDDPYFNRIFIDVQFGSTYQPREYNFETDSADVIFKMPPDAMFVIRAFAEDNWVADDCGNLTDDGKAVFKMYASYDGFISFAPQDIEDFMNDDGDHLYIMSQMVFNHYFIKYSGMTPGEMYDNGLSLLAESHDDYIMNNVNILDFIGDEHKRVVGLLDIVRDIC